MDKKTLKEVLKIAYENKDPEMSEATQTLLRAAIGGKPPVDFTTAKLDFERALFFKAGISRITYHPLTPEAISKFTTS